MLLQLDSADFFRATKNAKGNATTKKSYEKNRHFA